MSHRYPTYKLNRIKYTIIAEMVEGVYGTLPVNGKGFTKTGNGGLYKQVQARIAKEFGHTVGQETITRWKNEALKINPNIGATVTSTKTIRKKPTVTSEQKVERLSRGDIMSKMKSMDAATVAACSIFANRNEPLPTATVDVLDTLYTKYWVNRKK